MIRPHGGRLVNRVLDQGESEKAKAKAISLPKIAARSEVLRDIDNIAHGVFSPLEGFLCKDDFGSVLLEKRLVNGISWTIPIVLDVEQDVADRMSGDEVAITDPSGEPVAILLLEERYDWDKLETAKQVYGTDDTHHPGVSKTLNMGEVLLGGKIDLVRAVNTPFDRFNLSPSETRVLFGEKGWEKVCAFQTRNVPHVGHEHLQKTVLSLVDGLLIHPIIGRKKKGDFKDELILKAYEVLIEDYFARKRVVLSIMPTEMRYAGPREAIFHAIVRKNYGCTHIVIGRDHAGVGGYYHPEAAIEIFQEFPDLEIEPITIRGDFFYCKVCGQLASDRTCPHPVSEHIDFSGTTIRKMVAEKIPPPPEIMRPEVFEVLRAEANPFVE